MGAGQSAETVAAALPSVDEAEGGAPQEHLQSTVLYKFPIDQGGPGVWSVATRDARYSFYNDAQPSATKSAWRLDISGAEVNVEVDSAVEMMVELDKLSATFYHEDGSEVCKLVFPNLDVCRAFSDEYSNKLFENMHSGDEHPGLTDMYFQPAGVEPMDWDPEPDALPSTPPRRRSHWSTKEAAPGTGERVVGVAMGAGEHSFMVQEGRVGVLNNEYGGVSGAGTSFAVSPPPPPSGGGAALGGAAAPLTPAKVMLARGETQMNMLTTENREAVLQADLNEGKVVRQWGFNKNGVEVPMTDIAPDTKAAQLDGRSTFLGLDANRLARWDQRTAEGVVQDLSTLEHKAGKDYSRGTNFTCMATSGEGYVAVGSRDGRVRLYGSKKSMESFEFKQANTSVPGLGLPISAIDVSFDARYVVATTDKYLIVLQTAFKDAKSGRDTNGFVSRAGSQTPPPKLLRLSAEDRVKAGKGAKLSNARLTWITENDSTERWIVASFGTFSVLWNFRRIKAARPSAVSDGAFTVCGHYNMLPRNERVVANAFLHDKYGAPQAKNALVIATEHKLYNAADEERDESSDFE